MTNKISIIVATALFVFLGENAFAGDNSTPVTVYVFSAPPPTSMGFVDPNTEEADKDARRRNDSVDDIKDALAGKKGIRVVENPEEATIKLEVAWRSRFTFNVFSKDKDELIVIRARLMVDTYTLNMVGKGTALIQTGWRGAARNVAGQIDDWVKKNRVRLESQAY